MTDLESTTGEVPADLAVIYERSLKTRNRDVRVHSIELAGVLKIVAALKRVGMKAIPASLSILDFLTPEQREAISAEQDPQVRLDALTKAAESLHVGDRLLIEQRATERLEAIFHWVAGSEVLAPVLISAVSDLTEAESAKLLPAEALNVLGTAFELVDWKATVEAFMGFISRTGGLMAEVGRQSEKAVGKKEDAAGT